MPSDSDLKGPYPHRGKLRFRVRLGPCSYAWAPGGATEADARKLAEAYLEDAKTQPELTIGSLVEQYLAYLREEGKEQSTIDGARVKLAAMLEPLLRRPVSSLLPSSAKLRYRSIIPDYAAASHQTSLKYCRIVWRWAQEQRLVKSNPWDDVRPVGRVNKGKPQLTIDETKRLLDVCLKFADVEDGALAVAMAIVLALRSSEITKRIVRDVDEDGRRLIVRRSKTPAGRRAPEIPEVLRPAIMRRVDGRRSEALLLPYVARRRYSAAQWLAEEVRRYCELAGVPSVCPHGLRGGMASIAYAAGGMPHLVAAALGHASTGITESHYALRNAVLDGQQSRRLQQLGIKS